MGGLFQVKDSVVLTVTSLLSILLLSVHVSDDVVRGMSGGGIENLVGVLILVVWLCGTVVWAERRSGRVIVLLGSLLAAAMPVVHMRGAGVGGAFARSDGALLFIWTLYALGVTGTFSFILSVRGLMGRRPGGRPHPPAAAAAPAEAAASGRPPSPEEPAR